MNPLSRKTRREFIAAGLKSSAASFLTFPPTLARGQPLGTVPFVSEGETSPGSLHGSGLGGRLVLDLSTLTEDSLTTSNGNFFIRTAFPDQLHEISPWETAALTAALDFMGRTHQQDKPFFVWCNSTRMHIWTHLKAASEGVTGQGIYADGMVEHDGYVGQLLDKLDELGITDDTIVMYATDNGAELMSWPDGGMIPFRGEKNTTWEGGFRLPMMVRWPGKIKGGSISNEIIAMMDWMPTLVAAAGDPDIKEKLLNGHTAGGKTFKVHLDGYNFLPYMTGQASKGPRGRVLLLHRRRLAVGSSVSRLEDDVQHPGGSRLRGVGATVHRAARTATLQPASRPLRARRPRFRLLHEVLHRSHVRHGPSAGSGRKIPANFPEVPTAAEAGELHHRSGNREVGAAVELGGRQERWVCWAKLCKLGV